MPTADTESAETDAPDTGAADTGAPPPVADTASEDAALAAGLPVAVDEAHEGQPDVDAPSPDEPAALGSEDELALPEAGDIVVSEAEPTPAEEFPVEGVPAPPPRPIQRVLWNEKVPASAGCWIFWREAGFECRGKIERGLFTATCKGLGGSTASVPLELLLRRRFVSQGEALAVIDSMLSFDPRQAESLGFEITGRALLPFLPASPGSGALDEEQPAVSG